MSCNTPVIITEKIVCAKTCTNKFNETPIAKFEFSGYTLNDDSDYFDSGNVSTREVRWTIYCDGFLIYDFDYGYYLDGIPELSNGSTYNSLIMGELNIDVISFLETLPNTIIPVGTKFTLYLDVKDNTGVISQNISNKYCFNK